MHSRLIAPLALSLIFTTAARAADPPAPAPTPAPLTWTLDGRLRGEAFSTPGVVPANETGYELALARLRAGVDWRRGSFTLHGIVQLAGIASLPEAAVFGAGAASRTANANRDDVGTAGILEASAAWKTASTNVVLGRQFWADGAEVMTGQAYLDNVKRTRLGERLLGGWDWTNVGRRFDGLSAGWQNEDLHLVGFAFRPLAGGIDHDDALEQLDDLTVWGASATARYDGWIPAGEARLFLIDYDDERPGARLAAGGPIELLTGGGHLLFGGDGWDGFLWAAVQRGDWGRRDQSATALIAEAARRLDGLPGKPVLRGGVAMYSGDSPGGDHQTFLPLLPTKHKYHGTMDYVAFANLRTAYLDTRWQLPRKWTLAAGLHSFHLDDKGDAWYTGSGAFDEGRLGYTLRRPAAGGSYSSSHVGEELDLEVTRPLPAGLTLNAGVSWFAGGAAAEEAFPDEEDGAWAFVQLLWKRTG